MLGEENLVGREYNVFLTRTGGENMIGIYKIINLINNKIYIGQSINIELRIREHKLRAFRGDSKSNKEYYKALYKDFREFGLENFSFEIEEECNIENLNEREIYYINYYNSQKDGYNRTNGGDQAIFWKNGEEHPNHKLNENDVYFIRDCYNNHLDKELVYDYFKNKINKSGFHKIWNNITWKNVHQEVYTEENKKYYLFKRNSHKGEKNGKSKLSNLDVKNIRLRRKAGENLKDVYNDYKQINFNSFRNVWYYQNWKHVIV